MIKPPPPPPRFKRMPKPQRMVLPLRVRARMRDPSVTDYLLSKVGDATILVPLPAAPPRPKR
jgi:hypothetical protein